MFDILCSEKKPRIDRLTIQLQILKVVEIDSADSIRRPYIKQLLSKNLKFPLPHRAAKNKRIYAYSRPSTFA